MYEVSQHSAVPAVPKGFRRTIIGPLGVAVALGLAGVGMVFGGVGMTPAYPANASSGPAQHAVGPIKHVIILVKENHSFDNLFGQMPGVNGTRIAHRGTQKITMTDTPDVFSLDIDHGSAAAVNAINNGKMNKFYELHNAYQNGQDISDSQFNGAQMADYWNLAKTYSIADRFFSTIIGGSFPNHLVLISGGNFGAIDDPIVPKSAQGIFGWGCDSPAGTTARIYSGGHTSIKFPCFTGKTLADEANSKGVSWKYYAAPPNNVGYIWSSFDAVKSIRGTSAHPGAQWKTNVVNNSQFDTDITNGTLPAISWLTPNWNVSDHPKVSECASENWTIQKINEVMANAYTPTEAKFVLAMVEHGNSPYVG